jgi:hypothetical protein
VDIDADIFSFQKNGTYSGPLPSFLAYPSKMKESDKIKMWVLERAPDPNNEFIDALIKKIGETKYNAYSFFKYNNGVFITDKFYVEPVM